MFFDKQNEYPALVVDVINDKFFTHSNVIDCSYKYIMFDNEFDVIDFLCNHTKNPRLYLPFDLFKRHVEIRPIKYIEEVDIKNNIVNYHSIYNAK